jgi:hypothetical protein
MVSYLRLESHRVGVERTESTAPAIAADATPSTADPALTTMSLTPPIAALALAAIPDVFF